MTETADGHNGPTEFLPKLLTVWREGYGLADLRADALAGLTVAIVALPLSMAIAIASGVGPERGLYTAIVGGFLVSALGGKEPWPAPVTEVDRARRRLSRSRALDVVAVMTPWAAEP